MYFCARTKVQFCLHANGTDAGLTVSWMSFLSIKPHAASSALSRVDCAMAPVAASSLTALYIGTMDLNDRAPMGRHGILHTY